MLCSAGVMTFSVSQPAHSFNEQLPPPLMSALIPRHNSLFRRLLPRATLFALLALLLSGAMLPAATKPNIVYIMPDDLGYGELGCYGQTKIKTPNLDRMAAEGTRFTDVYSGAPVCAPSRCVLMTGKHTGHAYVRSNGGDYNLPRSEVTLAEVLRAAGYACGFVGKWSLGDVGSTSTPLKRGFDYAFGFYNQSAAHAQYPQTMDENDQAIGLPENAGGKRGVYAHDLMTGRS